MIRKALQINKKFSPFLKRTLYNRSEKSYSVSVRNISAKRYLEHREAFALLLLSLNKILTHSNNLFNALDQIDEWLNDIITMVNKVEILALKCGALIKKDEQ